MHVLLTQFLMDSRQIPKHNIILQITQIDEDVSAHTQTETHASTHTHTYKHQTQNAIILWKQFFSTSHLFLFHFPSFSRHRFPQLYLKLHSRFLSFHKNNISSYYHEIFAGGPQSNYLVTNHGLKYRYYTIMYIP